MEIIKNNHNDKNNYIEITCPHCFSVLKCTPEEYDTLPCPACSKPLNEKGIINCEHCNTEIYYDKPDGIGEYGLYYVKCPECNKSTYLDDGIDVTTDNLKLEYFSLMSENAVPIEFSKIKDWIKEGVEYLKQNPDEYYCSRMSGDSLVMVTKEDNDFYVVYTNDYRDVYIKE